MANLQIKGIDESLYSQIKKLASAENRSGSQQIIFLAGEYLVKRKGFQASQSPAQVLLELSGSWVDERTPEKIIGSSPNRVGKKGENDSIAQAQGGLPPGAGQPRREKSGVPERWPGLRKAPVPEPFA